MSLNPETFERLLETVRRFVAERLVLPEGQGAVALDALVVRRNGSGGGAP